MGTSEPTDFAFDEPKAAGVNLHSESKCRTCDGDRFVVVGLRPVKNGGIEEYAPCPDCNPIDVSFHRHNGTIARSLDPAKVRELMSQTAQPKPKLPRNSTAENRRQAQKLMELFQGKEIPE